MSLRGEVFMVRHFKSRNRAKKDIEWQFKTLIHSEKREEGEGERIKLSFSKTC